MDLTRDIIYRGFYLNNSGFSIIPGGGTNSGISGCVVDSADFSDADVVQFLEKRSQQDGMDANDPWLGVRRIRLAGTLYDVSRPALFDAYWTLRSVLSPVLASNESPGDHGYRPLYFSTPTNRLSDYPLGLINLQMLALPRAFQAIWQRDLQGGVDAQPLALPWQATFICRDPSILSASPVDTIITAGATSKSGSLNNRGTYYAPLNGLFVINSSACTITFTIGGSVFSIAMPASTGDRTIRFKGEAKLMTVEEGGIEVPRMDLLTFSNNTTWPQMPPGSSSYSMTASSAALYGTSHFWFYERFA